MYNSHFAMKATLDSQSIDHINTIILTFPIIVLTLNEVDHALILQRLERQAFI